MIVRAIDGDNDWTFGKGRNNYKKDRKAVMQSIKTRLQSFLGDCFFAMSDGVDWFNLLGSKNELQLNLQIATVILNTQDVTGLLQPVQVQLDRTTRQLRVEYKVQTTFGTDYERYQYSIPEVG